MALQMALDHTAAPKTSQVIAEGQKPMGLIFNKMYYLELKSTTGMSVAHTHINSSPDRCIAKKFENKILKPPTSEMQLDCIHFSYLQKTSQNNFFLFHCKPFEHNRPCKALGYQG